MTNRSDAMPYLKLFNKRDDIRFRHLSASDRGVWLDLMWLAGELCSQGLFIEDGKQLAIGDIAWKLHYPTDDLKEHFSNLKKAGLLLQNGRGYELADFSDEQIDWPTRRKKDRARKAAAKAASKEGAIPNGSQTEAERKPSGSRITESESDSEKDSEENQISFPDDESSSVRESAPPAATTLTDDDCQDLEKAMISAGLKPAQQEAGRIAYRILGSSGLGKPKLVKDCVEVAMRISPEKITETLLASLSSAYGNPRANNKPVVAVYQILHDSVPPDARKPAAWHSLPDQVLQAAGIHSLHDYIRHQELGEWLPLMTGGDEHVQP